MDEENAGVYVLIAVFAGGQDVGGDRAGRVYLPDPPARPAPPRIGAVAAAPAEVDGVAAAPALGRTPA